MFKKLYKISLTIPVLKWIIDYIFKQPLNYYNYFTTSSWHSVWGQQSTNIYRRRFFPWGAHRMGTMPKETSMSEEVVRTHFLAVKVNRVLSTRFTLLSSLIVHPSRWTSSSILKNWKQNIAIINFHIMRAQTCENPFTQVWVSLKPVWSCEVSIQPCFKWTLEQAQRQYLHLEQQK